MFQCKKKYVCAFVCVLIKWFRILISRLKFVLRAEVRKNSDWKGEMIKNYIYGSRTIRYAESTEMHLKYTLGVDHVAFSLIWFYFMNTTDVISMDYQTSYLNIFSLMNYTANWSFFCICIDVQTLPFKHKWHVLILPHKVNFVSEIFHR